MHTIMVKIFRNRILKNYLVLSLQALTPYDLIHNLDILTILGIGAHSDFADCVRQQVCVEYSE